MPFHQLLLKVGAPIIMLQSLDSLMHIVTSRSRNIINAKASSGRYKGEEVTIPQIPLILSYSTLSFQFRCLQFLVFAIYDH